MRQIDLIFETSTELIRGVAGVDEAGRGPLAGEVFAAAVILDPDRPIEGLNDSKRLTAKKRDALYLQIQEQALSFCIAIATVEEIDRLNILHASMLAMRRALEGLSISPTRALIDGNHLPTGLICEAEAWIGGDTRHPAIAAASILAKVARDRSLLELDKRHPQYGFARHKGYPTKAHMQALEEHGPCELHRRSFAPVQKVIARRSKQV